MNPSCVKAADIPKTCEACGGAFMAWFERAHACSKRCRLQLWRRSQPRKQRPPKLSADVIAERNRERMQEHRRKNRAAILERERVSRARVPLFLRQRRQRDYNLKMKYGPEFGAAQYEAMLVAQLGGCAICGRPPQDGKPLFVDHDHATGHIRALLCNLCNQGVAAIDACAEWLERATGYVARHAGRA